MDVKAALSGKEQEIRHKGQGARRLLHLASGIWHPASGILHPASFVSQCFDRI